MTRTHSRQGRSGITYTADHFASLAASAQAKTLPTATVQKIINEVLASPSILALTGDGAAASSATMTFAKETRDLLIECCVEFITMLSSEANEIAEKEAKKTIACEHITKALEELGFGEYVPECQAVAGNFKTTQVVSFHPLYFHFMGVRMWWWERWKDEMCGGRSYVCGLVS